MIIILFFLGALLTNNLLFGELCGCVFVDDRLGTKPAVIVGALTAIVTTLTALVTGLFAADTGVHLMVMAAVVLLLTQIIYACMKAKYTTSDEALKDDMAAKFEQSKKLCLPVALSSILLGIAAQSDLGYGYGVLSALATSIGYFITLLMMAGVRERIAYSKIPACLKGLPINLIVAGLMTLAFMGFTGLA